MLADISLPAGGSPVAGSEIATSDIAGLGPAAARFYGPAPGTDILYVRCPSDVSLGVQRVEASEDPRLDVLELVRNVRLFGATGDGTTDDTAAVQAAINAGGAVYFPMGTYKLTDVLTVATADLLIFGPGTLQQTTNLKAIFLVTADNVTIDGLKLVGTATGDTSALPGSYGSAAIFKQVNRGGVRNTKQTNCSGVASAGGASVWLTGSTDVTVEGNTISGAKIAVNTDAFYGVSWENTVRGNRFTGCARGYVGDLTGANGANSYGDIVHGNRIDGGSGNGIEFDDCQNGFTCTDNVVRDGTNGIAVVKRCRDFTVKGNRVRGASAAGIVLDHDIGGYFIQDGAVQGNRVRGCQDGLQLRSCIRLEVLGNEFTLNTRDGVLVPDGYIPRHVKFHGNSVDQNANYGMDLADIIDWSLVGNSIYANGTAAANTYSGVRITRSSQDPKRIKIVANDFFASDAGYTETQKYAVEYTAAVVAQIKLALNEFGTQGTAAVSDAWGGIERYFNGGDSGAKRSVSSRRTAGNFAPASVSWADLTSAMDLVLAAQAGDQILVALNGFWGNDAVFGYLDVASIVSGSPVNYGSSGSGTQAADGLPGWVGPAAVYSPVGGSTLFTVAAGDLSGGQVTLRLRVKCSAAVAKTLFAQTADPLVFSAVNLGP